MEEPQLPCHLITPLDLYKQVAIINLLATETYLQDEFKAAYTCVE